MTSIAQLLGDKADSLLNFKNPKISKERLHLPGPDFVDRLYAVSDRNNRVLGNLQRIVRPWPAGRHGLRLHPAGGPGHRAFRRRELRQEPGLFRPGEHREAGHRRRLQRRRLHLGVLGAVSRKYAHKIPFLVKINHNELLTYPNKFDQIMFGTVEAGAGHGRGGRRRDDLFRLRPKRRGRSWKSRQAFAHAHELGLATVLWCYLRNSAFKTKDKDYHVSADLTGQANHLGVTIQADIIKQKLPENNGGYKALNTAGASYGKFDERIYTELTSDHPIDLCRYQVAELLHGPRRPHQQRRRIQGRGRPRERGDDRRHQQARRRHGPDLRPQGVPASDEGRRRDC